MRVVIDTNIFVSSFFGGNPKRIIDLWKTEKITLCLSSAILHEYMDVLRRIGLKNETELEELLSLFSRGYNILFTTKTPRVTIISKDPADDKFIECAVALKATIVVSGDRDMLAVKEYMGIKILTPRVFLDLYHSL